MTNPLNLRLPTGTAGAPQEVERHTSRQRQDLGRVGRQDSPHAPVLANGAGQPCQQAGRTYAGRGIGDAVRLLCRGGLRGEGEHLAQHGHRIAPRAWATRPSVSELQCSASKLTQRPASTTASRWSARNSSQKTQCLSPAHRCRRVPQKHPCKARYT